MLCLDNSDWMRNSDYAPSRLESQQDAASIICNDRIHSNPENTVGILTMAGNGVDLLVSPTEEAGKILASFASVAIGGKSDLATSVQIAQLALKHRKNKNGGQRIVAFVGGPVFETKEKLMKIGKQLKKNNVAIDIISIGEMEDNSEKLLEFVNATNSNDNSHLITVPPGVNPVNAIQSSPIMHLGGNVGGAGMDMGGGGGGAPAGGAGGGEDFDMYGGINPDLDPELAMAIRVSAEEARAREEDRSKAAGDEAGASSSGEGVVAESAAAAAAGGEGGAEKGSDVSGVFGGMGADDEEDEEALMQRALEMSMKEMSTTAVAAAGDSAPATDTAAGVDSTTADDEDEDLAAALQLSMAGSAATTSAATPTMPPPAPSSAADSSSGEGGFVDPAFVSQLLGTADQSDPLIQSALAQLNQAPPAPGPGSGASGDDAKEDKNSKKRKGDGV